MAQVAKKRMHSAAHAAERGGCATLDSKLRGSLQHGTSAQCDRLRDAARYAGGTAGGDSWGAGSKLEEARRQRQLRRQQVSPSMFARFRNTGKMPSPGETEAGSAGTQPC